MSCGQRWPINHVVERDYMIKQVLANKQVLAAAVIAVSRSKTSLATPMCLGRK